MAQPFVAIGILASLLVVELYGQLKRYAKVWQHHGIREFADHWYVGDGMFSDGMSFHMNYYNGYVI